MKKMYETPLVQLQPEGEWSADMDALVVYTQLRPFPSSSWDWIGLYRVSSAVDAVDWVAEPSGWLAELYKLICVCLSGWIHQRVRLHYLLMGQRP